MVDFWDVLVYFLDPSTLSPPPKTTALLNIFPFLEGRALDEYMPEPNTTFEVTIFSSE